jgi:hypothetical protein
MKKWPKDIIAVTIIVEVNFTARQVDWKTASSKQKLCEGMAIWPFLHKNPRPTNPEHLVIITDSRKCTDKTTSRLIEDPFAI